MLTMKKYNLHILILSIGLCGALCATSSFAATVNLTNPEKSSPLMIVVDSERSKAYGWKPGERISIKVFEVNEDGEKGAVIGADGRSEWSVVLDGHARGSVNIALDKKSRTGSLVVYGNDKSLYKAGEALNPDGVYWVEKILEYELSDGAAIRVHFNDQAMSRYGADEDLPSDVMDAAVHAYQTITDFQGFSSNKYSFAQADPSYAIDPDKTIDVYLGDPAGYNAYPSLGLRNNLFKDAPCFDTIKISETQYQAVILLPANYRDFIRNWEKINPSPLGKRNIGVDLRGTLIHEMLHVIVFYYNKNINKSESSDAAYGSVDPKNLDWYVEGLARYFETFAGARHDFFSQGFKQTLPDKIRFSRGGSNYFMRYPDQAFTQLRYENALFWRYLDDRYGMASIEALSRDLRGVNVDFKTALERMTGKPLVDLLKDYAKAILMKDFGLKDETAFLNEVARCRLVHKDLEWHLEGSHGELLRIGSVCETDWVGKWEDIQIEFSEPSAAGDNTRISDVSGWATDYIEIKNDAGSQEWPKFDLIHVLGGGALAIQVLGETKGGSLIEREFSPTPAGQRAFIDLPALIHSQHLETKDIEKFYILITNTNPDHTSEYSLNLKS